MGAGPDVVFENMRNYGLAWRPPALLERPRWSDEDGNPLNLEAAPVEGNGDWQIEVNQSTDSEGWVYASVFKHFDYSRPGGRAGRRASDLVRRRKWVRLRQQSDGGSEGSHVHSAVQRAASAAELVANSLISPVTQMQGTRVRKRTEMEKRKTAVKVFLGMLSSTIRRRQLWAVMPMDPAAWFVLLTKQQAELHEHQAAALKSASSALGDLKSASKGQEGSGQPQSLIRDLMCAAVHSRAAYGYAMAAGHLASLYNFALLQTLQQFTFNAVGGASGEANNQAVATLAGIPPEDIKLAEWHNSVMRPCHYIAVDRANHCIVLSIRGSLEVGDVLSDLTAKPLEIFGLLETEGLVHEGMMAAATYVQCNTAPAFESLAKSHPGWPVFITGHSMGGGVATILTLLMRKGGAPPGLGPIRCVAIGPAPVLSRPLAEICNEFVISVVHGADVVPRISYASVEKIFIEFANSSPIGNLGRRVSQTLEGFKVEWPASLKPSSYGPRLPHIPSLNGLCNLVSLADNEEATAKAAHAAETAAALAELPEVEPASSIELSEQPHAASERQHSGQQASATGRQASCDMSKVPNSYGLSAGLSSSAAVAAASRLAGLRAESQSMQQPAGGASSPSADGQSKHASESAGQGDKVGEGARAAEDYRTAADILDIKGKEFQDESGHPEPLYVAGRVLWILPSREQKSAAEVSGSTPPKPELQLSSLNGQTAAAAEQMAELDAMQTEEKQPLEIRQRTGEEPEPGPQATAVGLPGHRRSSDQRRQRSFATHSPGSTENGAAEGSSPRSNWHAQHGVVPGAVKQIAAEEGRKSDGALVRSPAQKRPASAFLGPTEPRTQSSEFPSLALFEDTVPGPEQKAPEDDAVMDDAEELPQMKRAKSDDQHLLGSGAEATRAYQMAGNDRTTPIGAAINKRKGPAVLEVQRDTFERILLTLEMMNDHLPDSYVAAINQL